ncbi:GEVED domain-containing protein [Bernardetia sp. ABR2-2B]|uniref:GEVED domain-containing protein n=1 Tax=Bernardetia sp. ABR2-2B TaxID=3127472 RepID=UPI0030CE46E9
MTTNLRFQFFSLLLIFLCFTFSVNAQTAPPSNLSGSALRTWYKQNYHDGKHNTLGYSTARRYMYNYIDNKNNSITGVYSGFVQPWTYGGTGTNPAPINCEHTVPQSFFGKADPMVSDIHHLFPTYGSWNSTRSNYPFAEITDSQTEKWMLNSSQQTSVPSSNIDAYSEYASQTFEPREDQKGNTARAIFYFYTMYPTQAGSMSQVGDINVLYQWHLQDPVDAAEIDRNNKIEQYQGDRNPYIDYPSTVATAWNLSGGDTGGGTNPSYCASKGNSVSDEWINRVVFGSINNTSGANGGYRDYTNLTANVTKGNSETITIYPTWSGSQYAEGYAVWIDLNKDGDFNDSGELVFSKAASTSSSATGSITIPSTATTGTTRMRVSMKYNGIPTSCESFSYGEVEDYTVNIQSGITGGDGGTTPTGAELLISEYVEGSSNNKAIEIYNPTSSSVSLSSYSLKKQSNGAGSWASTLSLSGSLAAGQTYVIVYSSASTTLKNKADLITSSSALAFNGNDAVGLFKNSSLIDVVGVFNSSATFGQNVTLVRKATVSAGNTTYTASEWTSYSQDTFSYLGNAGSGGSTGGNTAAPTGYCTSKGNSVADEWINRVVFGSINNTSGANGGYRDYTNLSTTVSKGSSQTITIYPSWAGSVYNEAYTVFIDWNRDGDFNDAGETTYSRSAGNSSSVSGTINIPATASTGTTRMRVAMKYNANSTPCETFSYGEVEDYHINITGTAKISVRNNENNNEEATVQNVVNEFKIYPNPTVQSAKLQLSVVEAQNVVVRMFDAQGKVVSLQTIHVNGSKEISLPTNRLKTGLYVVEITGKDFRFTERVIKN